MTFDELMNRLLVDSLTLQWNADAGKFCAEAKDGTSEHLDDVPDEPIFNYMATDPAVALRYYNAPHGIRKLQILKIDSSGETWHVEYGLDKEFYSAKNLSYLLNDRCFMPTIRHLKQIK